MSTCWVCCWPGSCRASHRDGVAHAQWCWAEGHQPRLVRLERLPLPAGHTAAHSWVARGTAASSSAASTHVWHCVSVQRRAVAGPQQMCHRKQEGLPWARTPEGASSEPRAQGKPAGADAWPAPVATRALQLQPVLHAQYTQRTQACSALQGATICCAFRRGVPSCRSALTSPPLLPGKGEAEGECLTHLVFKAAMAAACDSLVGQAVGTSREGIWTSLQLLDTILLL